MKIVIVGNGKVGLTLAEELSKEDHDLILIDNNMAHLEHVQDTLDIMCYCGNGASYSVLKEAGCENADLLLAVTSLDEINLLCCLIAKKLNVTHTIARIRNPEYSEQMHVLKNELGLTMSINPEKETAVEIERSLRFPGAIKLESFARGKVELVEIKVKENCALINMKLKDVNHAFNSKILVCAVQRGDEVFIPDGNFVFQEHDRLSFTAAPEEIKKFFRQVHIPQNRIRYVMIVGGSKIAYYLARLLIFSGVNVKIIEQNEERCRYISEQLPKATVICGDGSDYNLLLEEGLETTDAFIALTGLDEMNLVISMYAQSANVHKVISKVNRVSYTSIMENTKLETVVSPKEITANRIIQFVRAYQNSVGSSNVETLHKVVNGKVEALEFYVQKEASYLHIPLKDLRFKKDVLVASIVRNRSLIIPDGNDTIQLNDRIVVVTTSGMYDDLADIFL